MKESLAVTNKFASTLSRKVSANTTTLIVLNCSDNNLTNLDMTSLNSLNCSNNQLVNLNAKNGINTSFVLFNATGNPNLNCITVDNALYATNNWTTVDSQTNFSEDCSSTLVINAPDSVTKKINVFPNPVSKTLNIKAEGGIIIKKITLYNILGQPIAPQIINDKINVMGYQAGLYLLKIETDQGLLLGGWSLNRFHGPHPLLYASKTPKTKNPSMFPWRGSKKGNDLLSHKCSTIGANGLNFSVRNGKR